MNFHIRDANLRFTNTQNRGGVTSNIIIHHVYGRGSVQDIHRWHQDRGWAGIGYHFYIDFDGSIWRGRDMRHVGAHTIGQNSTSIGIVVNGNHHRNDRVSDAMFSALVWLIGYIRGIYGNLPVRGHNEFANTNCPGQHFPMAAVSAATSASADAGREWVETNRPLTAYTVTTAQSPLNVRSAPSTDGRVLGTFPRGATVAASREANGWFYSTDGKISGWANGEFLRPVSGDEAIQQLASAGLVNLPAYWLSQLPQVRQLGTLFNRWVASLG